MPTDVALSCTCGTVTGTASVEPDHGNRLVCMCDDCQAYAHWLGRVDAMLDHSGGTEIAQMTPSQVRITTGHDQIRCVRLGPKGLMRWHSACCRTPIANTLDKPGVPFLGLPVAFMRERDPARLDAALGPILARIQGRFGKPPLPPNSHARAPLGLLLRSIRVLLGGILRGAAKPSPLFDAQGRPIAAPLVLSPDERAALRAKVEAFIAGRASA
jgi:hypothetical protein